MSQPDSAPLPEAGAAQPTQASETSETPESPAATGPTAPLDELEAANQRAEEYLRLAQRTQADFINYRRRVEQERAEQAARARGDVILRILPVLDDFERALAAVPPEAAGQDWLEGVRLIERKLRAVLESEGVTRIEAEGQPFDPWQHEAVARQVAPGVAPNTVIAVHRAGYRLGDRVLRPAQVVVATDQEPS